LKGKERNVFNHQLIFLNPNYRDETTPLNYGDWLDLIYESIHNPKNPKINLENAGIKRVVDVVNIENLTPEEMELAKLEVSKRKVIALERDEERKEMTDEIAIKLILEDCADDFISKITGLENLEIQKLRTRIDKNNNLK